MTIDVDEKERALLLWALREMLNASDGGRGKAPEDVARLIAKLEGLRPDPPEGKHTPWPEVRDEGRV